MFMVQACGAGSGNGIGEHPDSSRVRAPRGPGFFLMPPELHPRDDDAIMTAPTAASTLTEATTPRLYRSVSGRRIGGVAAGLADHLGLPPRRVRLAFVVLALASGLGILLYAAFWIVLTPSPLGPKESQRRTMGGNVVALAALAVALFADAVTHPVGWWFTPSALAFFGGALIWRQASETDRDRWRRLSKSSIGAGLTDSTGWLRLLAGVVLVVTGAVLVLAKAGLSQAGVGLSVVLVTSIGLALITGPWWVRLVAELSQERRERIRSEERAELAARLHDSVLQTLALIQRNSGSPREVTRLARSQERQLRALLYDDGPASGQFAEALRSAAGEVEDSYAVSIDVVIVGDHEMQPRLETVVAAARESMINAAKHSQSATASLYAEVDAASVAVFVRDRGVGFEPEAVGEDRHGVRGSIIGRMQRQRGTAIVRSSPGHGTEIELRMELP
jgi:signal transduction histidine kinase